MATTERCLFRVPVPQLPVQNAVLGVQGVHRTCPGYSETYKAEVRQALSLSLEWRGVCGGRGIQTNDLGCKMFRFTVNAFFFLAAPWVLDSSWLYWILRLQACAG